MTKSQVDAILERLDRIESDLAEAFRDVEQAKRDYGKYKR